MTNEELAKQFREKVPEVASLDYFDRFVDLAIYLNETLGPKEGAYPIIGDLLSSMVHAYEIR
jgi:hypothetical protein